MKENSNKISYLTDAITPDVAGVVWLTDEPLSIDTFGITELNYLMNGEILKSISQNKTNPKTTFYLGESFSRPFFIAHSIIDSESSTDLIFEHFKVISQVSKEKDTIYLFNKSHNTAKINLEKKLEKKYSQYTFKYLFL